MITRGHFIGQIIDELTDISHKVDTRCSLNLMDLNLHLENFFKKVLNTILGLNLENLNADRSNNPGLDLGDIAGKTAFQITSSKTSKKINDTLNKITEEDLGKYDTVCVLIIGTKQRSYTLDLDDCARCEFDESNIWDVFDLCKYSMDIPLDRLQNLFDYVMSEVVRIKIELEFPNVEGEFPTSISDYVEKIPQPRIGTCEEYCRIRREFQNDLEQEPQDVQRNLEAFSAMLCNLPRITRQFFALLIERHDESLGDKMRISNDKLRRICNWPDIDGELRLLEAEGLVHVHEPEDENAGGYVTMHIVGLVVDKQVVYENFHWDLIDYVHTKKLSFQNVFGNLDFGDF